MEQFVGNPALKFVQPASINRLEQSRRGLHPNFQRIELILRAVDHDLVVRLDIFDGQQRLLDELREDIDAAHDEHIVRAPENLFHADSRPTAAALLGVQDRSVTRAVTNDRHRLFGQRREDQLAFLAVRQFLARAWVDNLGQEVVFLDVHAVVLRTFDCHTGADDLGQAVDIKCLDPEFLFDLVPHLFGPRLRPENARAQFHPLLKVDAHIGGFLGDHERVRRRARQRRRAEVLHQHHLPPREAAGHRDHQRADFVRADVETETAGEQPVAVGIVNDVLVCDPGRTHRARHHFRPQVHIGAGVTADSGLASGARRSVNADNLLHRHDEHAEGVVVAQVAFLREWKTLQIVERLNTVGADPGIGEFLLVQRRHRRNAGDDLPQPLHLQFLQLLTRHRFAIRIPDRHDVLLTKFQIMDGRLQIEHPNQKSAI